MYAELSPDQLAAGMVRVVWDHGPAHVELTAPGAPTVRLQLHHNPGLTKAEADRLRAFLAAVVRVARGRRDRRPKAVGQSAR
jgi:hypothetical protein